MRILRDTVRAYMYEINTLLNQYKADSEPNDVQSIVPMNILKENEQFYEYIRNSNNQLVSFFCLYLIKNIN